MEIDSLEIGKTMLCMEVAFGIILKTRQKDKASG